MLYVLETIKELFGCKNIVLLFDKIEWFAKFTFPTLKLIILEKLRNIIQADRIFTGFKFSSFSKIPNDCTVN